MEIYDDDDSFQGYDDMDKEKKPTTIRKKLCNSQSTTTLQVSQSLMKSCEDLLNLFMNIRTKKDQQSHQIFAGL